MHTGGKEYRRLVGAFERIFSATIFFGTDRLTSKRTMVQRCRSISCGCHIDASLQKVRKRFLYSGILGSPTKSAQRSIRGLADSEPWSNNGSTRSALAGRNVQVGSVRTGRRSSSLTHPPSSRWNTQLCNQSSHATSGQDRPFSWLINRKALPSCWTAAGRGKGNSLGHYEP
jgi:hypothetical protein